MVNWVCILHLDPQGADCADFVRVPSLKLPAHIRKYSLAALLMLTSKAASTAIGWNDSDIKL